MVICKPGSNPICYYLVGYCLSYYLYGQSQHFNGILLIITPVTIVYRMNVISGRIMPRTKDKLVVVQPLFDKISQANE